MIDEINDWVNRSRTLKPIKSAVSRRVHNSYFYRIRDCKDKEVFRVLGMRRTGNHAIANWLLKQVDGPYSFCNDIQLGLAPETAAVKRIRIRPFGRPTLLVTYESQTPNDAFADHLLEGYGGFLRLYDILILRDPFNLFASRFAWIKKMDPRFCTEPAYRRKIVDLWSSLWKEHARYYLQNASSNSSAGARKTVVINYNRWVSEESYRRSLADQLGLRFDDSGFRDVKDFGSGSSFDGVTYRRRAQEMKVLERWKWFADDPVYATLFQDSALVELSDTIFGPLDGIDQMVTLHQR